MSSERYIPSKASLEGDGRKIDEQTAPRLPDETSDFVRVATGATATEAHVLRNVLQSAGLTPHVTDANIVQAQIFGISSAAGGVKLLVPAEQAEAAREALAAFHAGALELPDEDARPATAVSTMSRPVYSPDRAVLLSFVLTPVFGIAIQMVNARTLGDESRRAVTWLWAAVLAGATASAVAMQHAMDPGPFVVLRASLLVSMLTIIWYLLAGQAQSRRYVATFGARYPRKSLAKPALGASVGLIALGWALSVFM